MKNLISMTDFVLEQLEINQSTSEFKEVVVKYTNFLKQPLELWMFVPCDEDGNILEKPREFKNKFSTFEKYQQAKEKCLFERFTNSDEKENSFVFTVNDVGGYWIPKNDTIEGLMLNFIPDFIELTKTAIKQITL